MGMKIKTSEIMTAVSAVYSELVKSLRKGILAGDDIPSCEVIPIEKLKGRVSNKIFEQLKSVKYLLSQGNHRAVAYSDLSSYVPIETADLGTIQDYVNYLNSNNVKLKNINSLIRLPQKGALEQRINQGKFYRRN